VVSIHVLSKTTSHPPSPGADRSSPCGHLDKKQINSFKNHHELLTSPVVDP